MGDFNLLFLDQSLLESILSLLNYKDLLSLRTTCKGIKERINEFLRHFTSIIRRKCKEPNFFKETSIRHCWETELFEQLGKPNSDIFFYKYKDIFKDTFFRKSVCDADDFPHLGNNSYIQSLTDPHLQRSIVHLSTVCWLYCSIHFKNVKPGKYKPSIVLRLDRESFNYPSAFFENTPDIFVEIKSLEDSNLYSEGRIAVKDLRKWVHKNKRTQYPMLEDVPLCSSCPFKEKKKWRFVNSNWKNGIEWDFFQLRKIN
ncbi:unnamed protein product [Lepeophtheirus salmonis]|uniref:(salmon louse) hypothetical protein n=1 Tax=Lepeophtheirus salmonis TaxID=72036 RepID=A0A7R8D6A9_LEPSM|nr:unnamed protein product [Lepeophtheirus salmonis]CAF3043168.1 unnamed protein product [Lepeophtheirus salmonis]